MSTCLVPSTKGRMFQLTFEFDYDKAGLQQHEARLTGHAEKVQEIHTASQRHTIESVLEAAHEVAQAKECFKKVGEGTWKAYCQGPLGMEQNAANKLVQVDNVFGKTDPEELIGVPPSSLYKLAADKHKAARRKVLKAAKDQYLSIAEVDAILDPAKTNGASFNVTTPTDHDQLLAYLEKKVTPVTKRITEELCEEIPEALRELASKLEAE